MVTHVVRRSDRYWAGLSADILILQTLMLCIKRRGRLTYGGGMTENVRLLWTETLHQCAIVHNAMMSLMQTSIENNIQQSSHVDMSKSCVRRDIMDVHKLVDCAYE